MKKKPPAEPLIRLTAQSAVIKALEDVQANSDGWLTSEVKFCVLYDDDGPDRVEVIDVKVSSSGVKLKRHEDRFYREITWPEMLSVINKMSLVEALQKEVEELEEELKGLAEAVHGEVAVAGRITN